MFILFLEFLLRKMEIIRLSRISLMMKKRIKKIHCNDEYEKYCFNKVRQKANRLLMREQL
jgi:hypothetical protein